MLIKTKSSQLSVLAAVLVSLLATRGGPAKPVPAFAADVPRLFAPIVLPSELIEQAARQEKLNPDAVRSRYVSINFAALDATGPIGLDLFEDVVLTATKNRVEKRSADRYSWFGRLGTPESHPVILVSEKGVLAGDIRTSSGVYQVAYVGKGVHAIREIRPWFELHRDDFDLICCAVRKDPPFTVLFTPVIDLLVAYTPAATAAAGGAAAMEAQIQLNIDWANEAYRNSRIRQVLRLAYAYEVPYTEAADIVIRGSQALANLADPSDGVIDDIHRTRNKVGADLVTLWCFHGCGIANLFNSQADSAFSVANWSRSDLVAHELGHNMGAGHARDDNSGGGAFPYSWGYTDPNGAWHDVMSYGAGCGFSCPTIQHFSNPNVNYNGVPTGKPDGSVDANGNPDSADNARTLNETAPTIETFREAPAMITSPRPGSTLTCCQVTFTAQSRPNTEYFWMFGSGRNLADVIVWWPTGTTASATVTLPAWIAGQTLWVRLYTRVGGPTGTWHFRDHTYSVQ